MARDREILEQEKQELRLEKERVNAAALHIKQRVEEVKNMSKVIKDISLSVFLLEAKKSIREVMILYSCAPTVVLPKI